jgi:predicted RNA binding protein YcfA (HicA-like mRNA interferase family)
MPSATARDFQRVAHQLWNHPDGRSVTIPIHAGKEIGPPLFFKMLRQFRVSMDDFAKLR